LVYDAINLKDVASNKHKTYCKKYRLPFFDGDHFGTSRPYHCHRLADAITGDPQYEHVFNGRVLAPVRLFIMINRVSVSS
jgi:hypothetical protein